MPRSYINATKLAKKLARVPATIADGQLLAGQVLGVGGASWLVQTPGGDGLTDPVGLAPAGTWAGYIRRNADAQTQPTAGVAQAGTAPWVAVGESSLTSAGETLGAGHVLTSATDSSLTFEVVAPEPAEGYARYTVRPMGGA